MPYRDVPYRGGGAVLCLASLSGLGGVNCLLVLLLVGAAGRGAGVSGDLSVSDLWIPDRPSSVGRRGHRLREGQGSRQGQAGWEDGVQEGMKGAGFGCFSWSLTCVRLNRG